MLHLSVASGWEEIKDYGALLGWIAGYLTATQYQMPLTYAITTRPLSALDWIKEYCRRNDAENVEGAMRAFIWALYPQRIQQAPAINLPPVPLAHPVVPTLPEWQAPRQPQKTIPVKNRKRS